MLRRLRAAEAVPPSGGDTYIRACKRHEDRLRKEAKVKSTKQLKSRDRRTRNFPQGKPKYGAAQTVRYNPIGYKLDYTQPYKLRGILLVKDDLTAFSGKKKRLREETFMKIGPVKGPVCFNINNREVGLVRRSNRSSAYWKNLDFLCGNQRSSSKLKKVANFITDYGCNRNLLMKLREVVRLTYCAKQNASYLLLRAIAGHLGALHLKWCSLSTGTRQGSLPQMPSSIYDPMDSESESDY